MNTKLTLILLWFTVVYQAWSQTDFIPTEIDSFAYTPMAEAVPLNPYSGNAVRVVNDLNVAAVSEVGLDWTRYNNTEGKADHRLSSGWSHSFSWFLAGGTLPNGGPFVQIAYPDGNVKVFAGPGTTGRFWGYRDADYVDVTKTSCTLVTADNKRVFFPKVSQSVPTVMYATSVTDAKGNVTALTYTTIGGEKVLSKVTDNPSGHYLQINYIQIGSPYISSVVTSDGRSVSYSYHTVTSGSQTVMDGLDGATYSDGTTAAYTYTSNGGLKVLATATDVRASGIPNIRYEFAPFSAHYLSGFVKRVWNDADQSLVVEGSSNADGSNFPTNATLTYPDGRVYNHTTQFIDASATQYKVTNSVSGTTTFKYNVPYNVPEAGPITIKSTDAKGSLWTETRTKRGKLLSRTAPDGAVATFNWDAAGYLVSATDENGNTTTYTRAPIKEWVTLITYPDNSTESFTYNNFGQVLTHTRRNGGIESFTYTVDGLLKTHTSASGELKTYVYNTNYRVASITDGNNNTTSYEYNDRGQTTKVTNADSSFKTFSYDDIGNLLKETNELGNSGTYTYDTFNRLLTSTDPLGRKTVYTFDPTTPGNSSPTSILSPSGRRTEAAYQSAFGYRMSSLTVGVGTPLATTFSQAFDILGNVTTVIPPTGNVMTFEYDTRNRKTKTTDPAGNVTSFSYDPVGNLLTQTNANGSTVNTYDSRNRLMKSVYPAASPSAPPDPIAVSYSYDAEDAVKTYTDPNGNVYRYDYDLDERQLRCIYPDGLSQQFSYDSAGNIKTFITRDGRIKTHTYDNRNRCTSYSWSDGVTLGVTKSYDVANRLTRIANTNSAISYIYDAADDPIREVQDIAGLGGKPVQYSYSAEAELETMTYPDGTVVGYKRDAVGNLTDVLLGGMSGTSVVHYTYDASGNRTGKDLANGVNSVLTYDTSQRLASITDTEPASAGGALLQKFNFGYDSMNRLKYVKRANGLGDVYSYETRNQLAAVQYNATNPDSTPTNPSRSVSYIFDAAGNRKQTIDSITGTTSYVTNSNNQYTSVGGSPLSYDSRGNTTAFSGKTYTYDAENELLSSTSGQSPTTVHSHNPGDTTPEVIPTGATSCTIAAYGAGMDGYADASGGGGGGSYCAKTVSLSPSDWNQQIPYHVAQPGLIGEDTTVGSVVLASSTVNLRAGSGGQAAGNGSGGIASGGDTNTPGGNATFATGGNAGGPGGGLGGAPTQNGMAPGGGGGSIGTKPGTEGKGSGGQITFTYNVSSVPTTTFAYDAYGRCVKRTDNTGTTYMVYGRGWHLIAEYNVSGIQQGRYVQGPLPDEILTRTDSSGATVYYNTDHLGSVTKLTLSTGQLAEDYGYDVYGQATIRNASGTTLTGSAYDNRFMFTGREYLSSLNLYDYRNRAYSAQLGRFLQPDPVGHDSDLFNLYRYCGNNPVNKIDPSGLGDYVVYSYSEIDTLGNLISYTESWTYSDDAGNTYSGASYWRAARATSDPPSTQPEQSSYSYSETHSATPQVATDRQPNQPPAAAAAPAPAAAPAAAPVFDARSEGILAQLQPQVAALARQHLAALHAANIDARLVPPGLRTYEEQDRLYAQGRPGGPPGPIVTNARGGESNHNFGVAYDIGISRDGWRTLLDDGPEYDRAGALGTSLGLEWGGNWRRFQDRPHFQFTGGQTTQQLRQRFEAGLPVLP